MSTKNMLIPIIVHPNTFTATQHSAWQQIAEWENHSRHRNWMYVIHWYVMYMIVILCNNYKNSQIYRKRSYYVEPEQLVWNTKDLVLIHRRRKLLENKIRYHFWHSRFGSSNVDFPDKNPWIVYLQTSTNEWVRAVPRQAQALCA